MAMSLASQKRIQKKLSWSYVSLLFTMMIIIMIKYTRGNLIDLSSPFELAEYDIEMYSKNKLSGPFSYGTIRFSCRKNVVFIGGAEYVHAISLDNSKKFSTSEKLSAIGVSERACLESGKKKKYCANYVHVVRERNDGQLLVCGTNAGEPSFTSLHQDLSLVAMEQRNSGRYICPSWPNTPFVASYLDFSCETKKTSNIYGALFVDKNSPNPTFIGTKLDSNFKIISMEDNDQFALNGHPVGISETDDHVYFWYREIAPEYRKCDLDIVVSRIGRVCKNDKGHDATRITKMTYVWTTFQKVRVICQTNGTKPFQYNIIRDVFVSQDKIYALFNTDQIDGNYSSAICMFTNSDINKAFEGELLDTESSKRLPDKDFYKCRRDSKTLTSDEANETTKTTLLKENLIGRPFFRTGLYPMWIDKFVVQDVVGNKEFVYQVFFLMDMGMVYKVAHWFPRRNTSAGSNMLYVLKPFGNESVTINDMKIYNESLFITSDRNIMKIDVQQCHYYSDCKMCVRDPYCGWSVRESACLNMKFNEIIRPDLYQNVEGHQQMMKLMCKDSVKKVVLIIGITIGVFGVFALFIFVTYWKRQKMLNLQMPELSDSKKSQRLRPKRKQSLLIRLKRRCQHLFSVIFTPVDVETRKSKLFSDTHVRKYAETLERENLRRKNMPQKSPRNRPAYPPMRSPKR